MHAPGAENKEDSSSSHNVDLLSLPDDDQINKEDNSIANRINEISKSAAVVGPGKKMGIGEMRLQFASRSHVPAAPDGVEPIRSNHEVNSVKDIWYNGFDK